MVKIFVKIRILEGMEEAFLNDLKPCILATRQEEGCLDYTAYWNAEERELTLFECFKAAEAAAKHLEYPHFAVDFRALKKYYAEKAVAQRYENPII